jgi:hypothetical protein
LQNLSDAPVSVELARELTPFGKPAARGSQKLDLKPGASATVDALSQRIATRGHYHLRLQRRRRHHRRIGRR